MTTASTDHYEALEVPRDATPADLKTAYLRLIREYTPENDPERFRLVSEAYRTLSNAEKRKQYDREDALSPGAEEKLHEIMEQAEEDAASATRALRALRDKHDGAPGDRRIGFQLGILLDRQDRHSEAIEVFRELAEFDPSDVDSQVWLGDSMQKSGDLSGGRQVLKEAIVRDKDCTDAYFCLSRSYSDNDEHEESLKILDRGIHADGSVDIQDLPLFVEKILVLAALSDWNRLEVAAKNLEGAVPVSDSEAREFAASSLSSLVPIFESAGRNDLIHFILTLISSLDPSNEAARNFSSEIKESALAQKDRPKFYANDRIPDWFKGFVAIKYGDEEIEEGSNVGENLYQLVASDLPESRRIFTLAKRLHPDVVRPLEAEWNSMMSEMKTAAETRFQNSAQAGSSGCLLLFALGAALSWIVEAGV